MDSVPRDVTLPSLDNNLAARRPALEVRGVDAFEPVANLHRCYLRRDPVFLRSLLRLVGRKVNRRFYFSRLLVGSQRGRAGRRAATNVTVRCQDALAYLRALPCLCRSSLHLPRSQHELLWRKGAGA